METDLFKICAVMKRLINIYFIFILLGCGGPLYNHDYRDGDAPCLKPEIMPSNANSIGIIVEYTSLPSMNVVKLNVFEGSGYIYKLDRARNVYVPCGFVIFNNELWNNVSKIIDSLNSERTYLYYITRKMGSIDGRYYKVMLINLQEGCATSVYLEDTLTYEFYYIISQINKNVIQGSCKFPLISN